MASGKNGHLGVYALLHVEKANEQGQGPALLHSTGEDCVVDQKFNISLAILLFAQVRWLDIYFIVQCVWSECIWSGDR